VGCEYNGLRAEHYAGGLGGCRQHPRTAERPQLGLSAAAWGAHVSAGLGPGLHNRSLR